MKKGLLKPYFKKDPRVLKVLTLAKAHYDKSNLAHHNMDHISQVLYRAILIIQKDKLKPNPSILFPACILHDIGYGIILKKEGHEEAGRGVSFKILKKAGFSRNEADTIVDTFVNCKTPGYSIEADILYDADALDQSSYASMFNFFLGLYEYQNFPGENKEYQLVNFLITRIERVEKLEKNGLRTKAGKKILSNGFWERKDFIKKSLKSLKQRNDFTILIDDLV